MIDKPCCSNVQDNFDTNKHWEDAYQKREVNQLGWFQSEAKQSINLIEKAGISKEAAIADIGSGASILIDNLLEDGYQNIIATDISSTALNITKKRIGKDNSEKVRWILDDLTKPTILKRLKKVKLWHDRAVFHFLTESEDRNTYFDLINNALDKGSFVILATFHLKGAEKCCDLNIERYDEIKLASFLGNGFELKHFFEYDYINPRGEKRPYIYTLFQKIQ